mmetsp:Transcript_13654/g.41555  ORF Transcript_13654/g.41555 Transcript_13654/m.41555 type:complete len:177 (+) Transcript_13654:148-678(+)
MVFPVCRGTAQSTLAPTASDVTAATTIAAASSNATILTLASSTPVATSVALAITAGALALAITAASSTSFALAAVAAIPSVFSGRAMGLFELHLGIEAHKHDKVNRIALEDEYLHRSPTWSRRRLSYTPSRRCMSTMIALLAVNASRPVISPLATWSTLVEACVREGLVSSLGWSL